MIVFSFGVDEACSRTEGGSVHHSETWWWKDAVNYVVKEKLL